MFVGYQTLRIIINDKENQPVSKENFDYYTLHNIYITYMKHQYIDYYYYVAYEYLKYTYLQYIYCLKKRIHLKNAQNLIDTCISIQKKHKEIKK